jgi:hypothetical protein
MLRRLGAALIEVLYKGWNITSIPALFMWWRNRERYYLLPEEACGVDRHSITGDYIKPDNTPQVEIM